MAVLLESLVMFSGNHWWKHLLKGLSIRLGKNSILSSLLEELDKSIECISTWFQLVNDFMSLMKIDLEAILSLEQWTMICLKARGLIVSCDQFIARKAIIDAIFVKISNKITINRKYKERWLKGVDIYPNQNEMNPKTSLIHI